MLLNDELDSVRFENLWNLDVRWAKSTQFGRTNFQVLGSNLSPRIVRFGVRVGF